MGEAEATARELFDSDRFPSEDRADLAHFVQTSVRHGFQSNAEIVEGIGDLFPDVSEPGANLAALVGRVRAAHEAELSTLPPSEDFGRLARAFDALCRQGIIALHAAGTTQSDAIGDAGQVYHEVVDEGRPEPIGYAFYHSQDLDRAIDGHGLYVGFGRFDADEAAIVVAAETIRATLVAEGFDVAWNGDAGMRLSLPAFVWRKHHDDEDWGIGRAIAFLPSAAPRPSSPKAREGVAGSLWKAASALFRRPG